LAEPDVFLSTEVRLHLGGDGRYHAEHNAAQLDKWAPYVRAFGRISIVARTSTTVSSDVDVCTQANDESVLVAPIPDYRGLGQLVARLPRTVRAVWRIGDRESVFIGRLPEPLSLLLFLRSRFLRARYVSLVVADPAQLALTLWNRPGRRLAASALAAITRHCVRKSSAVVYVTQRWLQEQYPATDGTPTLARSNVALGPDAFAPEPRAYGTSQSRRFRLVTIGTLATRTKGVDLLCRAVARLRAEGLDVCLDVIGGGVAIEELKALADDLGVSSAVRFLGHLNDAAEIREFLDTADVYVSASRAEGLPRATIEAMARALPVVSTRAGGSAELVDEHYLVDIDDLPGFIRTLDRVVRDSAELERLSQRSLRVAKEVSALAGQDRLSDFLRSAIRECAPPSPVDG
jgi:glycosyltransferase involved in cell wall biosynthesis